MTFLGQGCLRSYSAYFLLTAAFLWSASGRAALYIETGFGVGRIDKGHSFFGGNAPDQTGVGLGENLTFANAFGTTRSLVQFHLGVQQRYTQGSANGSSYAVLSMYPLVRIETPRMYFGFGASPLIRKKTAPSGSSIFSGYSSASGAFGFFGEVGLLWKIVPFFHLALAGSAEAISNSGSYSPQPAAQITFQMRFYLGDGPERGGKSRKYDGWRYPFGIEIF